MYSPHTRLSLLGGWTTAPEEIFVCSINVIDKDTLGPVTAPDTFLTDIQAAISAAWSASTSGIPSSAQLVHLKAAAIGADGKYTGTPEIFDYVPSVSGGGGQTPVPGFCSLAITFRTDRIRPPGKYGRIFPPNASNCAVDFNNSQFTVGDSATNNNVGLGVALLDAIKLHPAALPVVSSKVDASNTAITVVSSDDVVDTQRRRKNKITGVRVATANPYP